MCETFYSHDIIQTWIILYREKTKRNLSNEQNTFVQCVYAQVGTLVLTSVIAYDLLLYILFETYTYEDTHNIILIICRIVIF